MVQLSTKGQAMKNQTYIEGIKEAESSIKHDGLAAARSNLEFLLTLGCQRAEIGRAYLIGYADGIKHYKNLIESKIDF